jgi:metal iron transporter
MVSSVISDAICRLYQACGILGATVMPHSLYLGSGIVQPRLLEYDIKNGHVVVPSQEQLDSSLSSEKPLYQPSLAAIKFCLKYSVFELALSLFTFALFVNSAILIVAGSSPALANADNASLFSIHDLLSTSIAPAAGTIFALALLLSGISAGIICTIAGQMVSEGALNWSLAPWLRRLVTRCISITPSIIIAGAVGKDGLTQALNGSQVALSVVLPFVSAPVVYFTCRNKFMSVKTGSSGSGIGLDGYDDSGENERSNSQNFSASGNGISTEVEPGMGVREGEVKMRNNWVTTAFGVAIWLIIASMNVANLVLLGLGN